MFTVNSFVLYVEDIERSKKFYSEALECECQQLSPTFVSIPIDSASTITLKQLEQVTPSATMTGGGTELSLLVPDTKALHELYDKWLSLGGTFIQKPTDLVFA